jgi:NAD(P)-dependent dehydrogenase (short-subunit alcohol dehydrogenase family)
MQLQGKTALIAGAGRNNGKAIALKFAAEGADLILVSRSRSEELNQVAKECETIGVKTLPLLVDVTDHEKVNEMVKASVQHFGKVDVLVSVAGMRPHKDFWEISYEEWHQVFAVNLHSTFYLARALVPEMMKRKSGNIIALGGGASLTSQPQRF